MSERADRLRKMLDELGIEHSDFDKGGRTQTMWQAPDGFRHLCYETAANPAKTAKLKISWFPTPEQAIAATIDAQPERLRGEKEGQMATNREWLDYLAQNAPDELAAWFDAEHVEHQEWALDGDTDALERKSADLIHEYYKPMVAELQAKVDELTAERDEIAELVGWHGKTDGNSGRPLLVPMVAAMCEGSEVAEKLQVKVDELTAERDELKGQVFTLKCECEDLENEIHNLTAERDLLTDDDANDDSAHESGISDPDGGSNVAYIAPDTREMLEADIWYFIEHNGWFGYEYEAESYADCRKAIFKIFEEWLDRQAAITERETTKRHELFCETCEAESDKQIAELTAERDNLKDELIDERGKLNRKMNALREVARDYRNERDHYRSKFGKCLDYADAIHALMDDEGMA